MYSRAEILRRWRQKHKEKGLCWDCKAKAVPGKSRCEKHRQRERAFEAARRQKRVQTGVCIRCRRNKALPGCSRCVSCLLEERQTGRRRTRDNSVYRQMQRSYMSKLQKKRKKEGKCVSCGSPVLEGYARCEGCLANHHLEHPKYVHNRLKTDLRGYLHEEKNHANNQQDCS